MTPTLEPLEDRTPPATLTPVGSALVVTGSPGKDFVAIGRFGPELIALSYTPNPDVLTMLASAQWLRLPAAQFTDLVFAGWQPGDFVLDLSGLHVSHVT